MKTKATQKPIDKKIQSCLTSFPFNTRLSFEPLLDKLKERANLDSATSDLFKPIVEHYAKNKILLSQELDVKELKQALPEIKSLIGTVFPLLYNETAPMVITAPFSMEAVFSNKLFDSITGCNYETFREQRLKDEQGLRNRIQFAASLILKWHYGFEFTIENPFLVEIPHPETKLRQCFRAVFNTNFLTLNVKGSPPKISQEQFNTILNNYNDLDVWFEHIKPEHFEFSGALILSFVNVTHEEVLSDLKYHLLQNDSITSTAGFDDLQKLLRSYFNDPSLKLGLATFDADEVALNKFGLNLWKSFTSDSHSKLDCSKYENCIYAKVASKHQTVAIENLSALKTGTPIEDQLLEKGFTSIAVSPLVYNGEIIGVLELGSERQSAFNGLTLFRLRDIIPMFSIALQRSLDELTNKVRAIIQQNCTSIHPSVSWKFEEQALELLDKNPHGPFEMNSISFDDVYPLYSAADIRSSSTLRSEAIREDLLLQLDMANDLFKKALDHAYVPIIDELSFQTEQHLSQLKLSAEASDENTVVTFIQEHVNNGIQLIDKRGILHPEQFAQYWNALDKRSGVVYKKRKAFEQSLTFVNEQISRLTDIEEAHAQTIFPHFFEKYKTDGVEHNLYVGQSLTQKHTFNDVYLKNLRLWQLMLNCKIAGLAEREFSNLPMGLELTQLVLVHSTPLSIQFRMDEKKFDVNGAYNIRYEIVKKRIDKATIRGTDERLTQPNKLAIIYSYPGDRKEYSEYIEFLQARGWLTSNIEHVELNELPGAMGLKAIRVSMSENIGELQPSKAPASAVSLF